MLLWAEGMDWVTTLGLAMGASWISGIRLYACVAALGLLQRFGLAELPGSMAVLSHDWVVGAALILFVMEFLADKIAYVDSVWDAVHTFIRIPAGAVLAASAFADFDPAVQAVAFLVGGSIAFSSHGTKAAARYAVNHSPEPVSNTVVSLGEDAAAAAGIGIALWLPALAAVTVALFVLVSFFFLRTLWRALSARLAGRKQQAA